MPRYKPQEALLDEKPEPLGLALMDILKDDADFEPNWDGDISPSRSPSAQRAVVDLTAEWPPSQKSHAAARPFGVSAKASLPKTEGTALFLRHYSARSGGFAPSQGARGSVAAKLPAADARSSSEHRRRPPAKRAEWANAQWPHAVAERASSVMKGRSNVQSTFPAA